ncbi:MAG: ATP-binding protein [Saprospiraceae bacterium]|nr:ATP-binding protein [Saprospiraceae bacterium]
MQPLSQALEALLYEAESTSLDFKRDQYLFIGADDIQKSELLKDILAFANSWRRVDAYILIGVLEVKGGKSQVIGISQHLDDAQLQQFVNEKIQRPISFSYYTTKLEETHIGVIHIPVQKRPFYLVRDFGKLKKNIVYIRRGTSTTDAKPDEIVRMGEEFLFDENRLPDLDLQFGKYKERSKFGKSLSLKILILKCPKMMKFQIMVM